MDDNTFICKRCESEVPNDAEYCPSCGALFTEDLMCINHNENKAEGVCVICEKPFCSKCGSDVDDLFLCFEHEHFEIIENMGRVFGTSDIVQIEYAKDCLEKENLNPFAFSKKASPLHLGGGDYSLFRAAGETPGNPVNEIKLMVPKNEVLKSLQVLKDIEIIDVD